MAARTTKASPKEPRRKRKPTRCEVASAVFDWVNRIRSTLSALADTVEETRREVQKVDSPIREFLCSNELLDLERGLNDTICATAILFPDNALGIHIDSPLSGLKGGV